MARPPAPPYRHEGAPALWHYSEDPTIEVFRPQRVAEGPSATLVPAVWAVDTRHSPMFWFPRDCPRACAWVTERASADDLERIFGHTEAVRIHVIEQAWLAAVQEVQLYAYRLPAATFAPHDVGGYWTTTEIVEPLEVVEVDDVLRRHADAGIELRIVPSIWPWWRVVVRSSVDFSGSRLRNCTVPPPEELAQL